MVLVLEEQVDHTWVADDPVTGQFGHGLDPTSAIDDLLKALRGYYDILTTHTNELSGQLKQHLESLQRRFDA